MTQNASALARPIPPQQLIELVGSRSPEHFAAVGEEFLAIFKKYAALKATDRVLDVGCGCGRMALSMTKYLTAGSYEGFDIVSELIEWAQANVTTRWPNFHFQAIDLYSSAYNRATQSKASGLRFPYPDNSFDLTFLTSVFTHMLPDDMENYTREIARTLKPGGRALITFFLLDEYSMRHKDTPASGISIPYSYLDGQVHVHLLEDPENIVGYPESTVRRVFDRCGLELQEPIIYGYWCGRPNGLLGQDITLSVKR